jgi:hypothetical protein
MFGIENKSLPSNCLNEKKQKNVCISNFQNAQKRRISNLSQQHMPMNEHPAKSFCHDLQECSQGKSSLDGSPRSERWDLLISPIVHRELDQHGNMHPSLSSSDSDDTSDEAFHRRHLPYELQEQNASMRVYQNSSVDVDTGQDLSGMSCFEDSGPKINDGLCNALGSLESSCAFAQSNRLAGEHLTHAGVLKRTAKPDCWDSPIICIDANAKLVLHIDGTPGIPDFDS